MQETPGDEQGQPLQRSATAAAIAGAAGGAASATVQQVVTKLGSLGKN